MLKYHVSPFRSGPRERLVETITYFHGYPLVGDGNISATRLELLSSLLNQLRDCFCDASEDVLMASAIGSFKLWPDKFKQGTQSTLQWLINDSFLKDVDCFN